MLDRKISHKWERLAVSGRPEEGRRTTRRRYEGFNEKYTSDRAELDRKLSANLVDSAQRELQTR